MPSTAIIDAGPLIALFDKDDRYHGTAKGKIHEFRLSKHGGLAATWPVISEAAYHLHTHVCLEAQLDFLQWIQSGGLMIFPLTVDHLARVASLQAKYKDQPMDFADATLLAAAEHIPTRKVFSIDGDFTVYRIFRKLHFENLMG